MIWEELFPVERYRLAHLLIESIMLYTDRMVLNIKTNGIKSLAQEIGDDAGTHRKTKPEDLGIISLTVPVELRHHGNRRKAY